LHHRILTGGSEINDSKADVERDRALTEGGADANEEAVCLQTLGVGCNRRHIADKNNVSHQAFMLGALVLMVE
jgi:hypothetical protein